MVILRLKLDEDEEVQEYTLNEDGSWRLYEGEEEIEFYLDQDRCDRNMIENLGDIPFLGHQGIVSLWTIEEMDKPNHPFILSSDESPIDGITGSSTVLLFHRKKHAVEFLLERGLVECEAVRVDDVKQFLNDAGKMSLTVILEPFRHRATGGVLWLNEQDIVLDSFSGFWILGDGWNFSPAL